MDYLSAVPWCHEWTTVSPITYATQDLNSIEMDGYDFLDEYIDFDLPFFSNQSKPSEPTKLVSEYSDLIHLGSRGPEASTISNSVSPSQLDCGQSRHRNAGSVLPQSPSTLSFVGPVGEIQDSNIHKTTEQARPFSNTLGADLQRCKLESKTELFKLPEIWQQRDGIMMQQFMTDEPFDFARSDQPEDMLCSAKQAQYTELQPIMPRPIQLYDMYQQVQDQKQNIDRILSMFHDIYGRESSVQSPNPFIKTRTMDTAGQTLDDCVTTKIYDAAPLQSPSASALYLRPNTSTTAQRQSPPRMPKVGHLQKYERCLTSMSITTNPNREVSDAQSKRRPRTGLVQNPCFICRLCRKKCSKIRPCKTCTTVDYRKLLGSLEPCIGFDENPFRFWIGNTLFNVAFTDERLFKLARIPNPLRKLELLWFIDRKAIRSSLGPSKQSWSIKDVRVFGTCILEKMAKWRDFSATHPDAQFLFIAACDLLILFCVEVTRLYKQAMRLDFSSQFGSKEQVLAFIDCNFRCMRQLLVARAVLLRRNSLNVCLPGCESICWFLSAVKAVRPNMASELDVTMQALEMINANTQRYSQSPLSWLLLQSACELQFEPLIEQGTVTTNTLFERQNIIFSFSIASDWLAAYQIGGHYHLGFSRGRENGGLHQAVSRNNLFVMEILLGRRALKECIGGKQWRPLSQKNSLATLPPTVTKISRDPAIQLCRPPEVAATTFEEAGTEWTVLRATNVNAVNELGETALHLAARFARPAFVEILIEEGAFVNALDCQGRTPLHHLGLAIFASELDLRLSAQLLCEAGADLSIRSSDGITAIQGALLGGARFFQEMSDRRIDLETRTNDGDTILHIAAREGGMGVVEMLIEAGANVHATNNAGDTPLHLAGAKRDYTSILRLLQAGANIHAVNYAGDTPLHTAAAKLDFHIVECLLQAGANIDSINKNGDSPLHIAVAERNDAAALCLLKRGANVHSVNTSGDTALHFAAAKQDSDISECLLQAGANINAMNNAGYTPLKVAATKGCSNVIDYLVKAGADVKAANL